MIWLPVLITVLLGLEFIRIMSSINDVASIVGIIIRHTTIIGGTWYLYLN